MALTVNPKAGGALVGGALPEGMSQLFWDTVNASPEAEEIRKQSKALGVAGQSQADTRQLIDRLIAKKWAELPPEKQKEYHHQDEIGSTNVPDSPAWKAEHRVTEAGEIRDLGEANYTGWEEGPLADLQATATKAAAGDQAALARLEEIMGSIKDPVIKDYVGDYISQAAQAGPSQQAMDDQRKEYLKLSGLTDPTITAEERLMQETSRRQQEQDLRSQRGAFANDLQARGMYGSGAELTMNLAQSQESAQRRAIEEMTAQSNAQKRAMDALVGAADISGDIRESEAQESQFRGTAADKATEFNKTLRDGYDRWVTEQQRKQNQDTAGNALGLFGAQTGVNRDAVTRATGIANTTLGGVQGHAAARTAGFNTEGETIQDLRNEEEFAKGKVSGL